MVLDNGDVKVDDDDDDADLLVLPGYHGKVACLSVTHSCGDDEIKIFAPLLQPHNRLDCSWVLHCAAFSFDVVILHRMKIKKLHQYSCSTAVHQYSCNLIQPLSEPHVLHCQICVYCVVMQYILQMSAAAILSLYLPGRNVNLVHAYPTSVA